MLCWSSCSKCFEACINNLTWWPMTFVRILGQLEPCFHIPCSYVQSYTSFRHWAVFNLYNKCFDEGKSDMSMHLPMSQACKFYIMRRVWQLLWWGRNIWCRFFFSWGDGVPPSGENFVNPPIRHLSPFLDQSLSPPQPRFVRENLNTLVSNLTTFKLKSYLKKLYFMLKIAKNDLILH